MLPPTNWKTVKQPEGSKVCGAAVAAMATGCTLIEAMAGMKPTYCQDDGACFFKTREVLTFLCKRGIYVGMICMVQDGKLWPDADIKFDVNMANLCALLLVPSKVFEGKSHYVFWDGKHVRDPSPRVPETTRLEDYEVQELYPLTYIDESGEDAE